MILKIREYIQRFYNRSERIVVAGIRFFTAAMLFLMINSEMGYVNLLGNFAVILLLALVCVFLPSNVIVVLESAVVIGQLTGVSMGVALVGGGLLIAVLLLYHSFGEGNGWTVILMPLALACHIPALIPLTFGLIAAPVSLLGCFTGIVIYEVMMVAQQYVKAYGADTALMVSIEQYLNLLLRDRDLLSNVVIVAAAFAAVYLTRTVVKKYFSQMAVVAGGIVYILLGLVSDAAGGGYSNVVWLILGTAISMDLAWLVQIFLFPLDFRNTEELRFEDETYYYCVQAIPKRRISPPQKKAPKKRK